MSTTPLTPVSGQSLKFSVLLPGSRGKLSVGGLLRTTARSLAAQLKLWSETNHRRFRILLRETSSTITWRFSDGPADGWLVVVAGVRKTCTQTCTSPAFPFHASMSASTGCGPSPSNAPDWTRECTALPLTPRPSVAQAMFQFTRSYSLTTAFAPFTPCVWRTICLCASLLM
jgi:hypothetical protein